MRTPALTVEIEGEAVALPSVWTICTTCRGNGSHSLHLGAITGEEWERDWSPEEREDYTAECWCLLEGRTMHISKEIADAPEFRAIRLVDDAIAPELLVA